MTFAENLARFLERVFLGRDPAPRAAPFDSGSSALLCAGPGELRREPRRSAPARRPASAGDPLLLTIDDAGQYLLAPGSRLVLGHLRGGRADLPFLADLGATHAVLERHDSFRDGSVWTVAPVHAGSRDAADEVLVNGRRIEESSPLAAGDEVRLGGISFRYRVPDPASETALLQFTEGMECAGATRILLFGEGEGGRVRIGASEHRHVRVANLEHEITLHREADRLAVRCEAVIRTGGGSTPPEGEPGITVPLPLPRRLDLSIGKPEGGRPPFGISIAPADITPPLRRTSSE